MATTNIEITIPVLDEEDTLKSQIEKIDMFLNANLSLNSQVSLVIVDNGSTDKTPMIAQRLSETLRRVRYIRLEERGVGRALKASWLNSKSDIVGYMDLDLATDLKHLEPALELIQGGQYDVVTGSRLLKASKAIGRPPIRTFTSKTLNVILQTWFDVGFSDGMCGFKFLRSDLINELMAAGAVSDGWFFATEILIAAEALGYKVGDIPVEWTDDPNSKVKILKLTAEYLKAMKRLKCNLKEYEKNNAYK
ncbi:Glycosyltransferase involved in cell wall bisynthesis [Pseudidiomarina planktonica]|uniref:Glycosyltransferase involved in cell wall bisynthesis n=1 Tax=Pseudidiomarina planktonica TaxID=1323738 RepID=A0A1Y6EHG0_9GAMM|nr:glycosyltransferase [Pseudidiomarina planktonica]RUO65918.1 glycosyltransferase [Pseudidiomarina planktonica]SMQ61809.1 Glycosyltransferase involved in cell wall bisynthesis [Pseudidiomarina planktonica]